MSKPAGQLGTQTEARYKMGLGLSQAATDSSAEAGALVSGLLTALVGRSVVQSIEVNWTMQWL